MRKCKRRITLVMTHRMTVSTFHYDHKEKKLSEYEMYFKIARRGDPTKIRANLAEKGREHFRKWLNRHDIPLQRDTEVHFELEQAAKRTQEYASVRRFVIRRINKRWVAEELAPGRMRYGRRRRKHGKRSRA